MFEETPSILPKPIQELSDYLSQITGVGKKTGLRIALAMFYKGKNYNTSLGEVLCKLNDKVSLCEECFFLSENKVCSVCRDQNRDDSILCIVQEPTDVLSLERSRVYKGKYHVLGGAISPIDGIGPKQLKIEELKERLKKHTEIQEILIATNPDIKGEATADYIKLLFGKRYHLTRLSYGVSAGTDIQYADEITLQRAISDRRDFK